MNWIRKLYTNETVKNFDAQESARLTTHHEPTRPTEVGTGENEGGDRAEAQRGAADERAAGPEVGAEKRAQRGAAREQTARPGARTDDDKYGVGTDEAQRGAAGE